MPRYHLLLRAPLWGGAGGGWGGFAVVLGGWGGVEDASFRRSPKIVFACAPSPTEPPLAGEASECGELNVGGVLSEAACLAKANSAVLNLVRLWSRMSS